MSMASCCETEDYNRAFGPRYAAQLARKYRRRGLDRTSRGMVDWVEAQGIQDATVLEIGGGVGSLHVELLRRGAARATNLELSSTYDDDARSLAEEYGVADRITRLRTDVATDPDAVEVHDIVVLHRVVCCYPDAERLLNAAATRAERLLIYSHPPNNALHRALTAIENTYQRVARHPFRTFVHDPRQMAAAVSSDGFALAYRRQGVVWQVAGFTTAAG